VRRALGAVSFLGVAIGVSVALGCIHVKWNQRKWRTRSAPSSASGEGWGGGERARSIFAHAPTLALEPKSDVSDFGRSIKRSNSGKPEFDCKRGRECTECRRQDASSTNENALSPPEQPFDVGELQFHVVIALAGIGRRLHFPQQRVHLLALIATACASYYAKARAKVFSRDKRWEEMVTRHRFARASCSPARDSLPCAETLELVRSIRVLKRRVPDP